MAQGSVSYNKSGSFKTQKSLKVNQSVNDATFRKTGALAATFTATANGNARSSSDLERIESEYIKNLQQQVYFLELEANYLREEARRAAELQPQMSAEAKRMVSKLAEMQSELDSTRADVQHKTTELESLSVEKEKLLGKLKFCEESHQREKRLLQDEIEELKREKELLDRSLTNKDSEILDIHEQYETINSVARTADNKIRLLESQLSQKVEQFRLLQQSLDDKRAELMRAESKLRETEERFYNTTPINVNDKVKDDLREEIRLLRQKMKDIKNNPNKTSSSNESRLRQENEILHQQITQLQQLQQQQQRQPLDDRRQRRDDDDDDDDGDDDKRNESQKELEQTNEQLEDEKVKIQQLTEQLTQLERESTGRQLSLSTERSRVAELTAMYDSSQQQTTQLQHDYDQLVTQIHQLQSITNEKDVKLREAEKQLRNLDPLLQLHSSIDSQKWEEFSRLADSMKSLSRRVHSSKHT